MSINLPGVESSLRISLEGIDEAKKQFADLKKTASSVEKLDIAVEANIEKIDLAGLRKQLKNSQATIQAALKDALKAEVDFSTIRKSLQKELGDVDAEKMLGPLNKQIENTKKLMSTALASVREMATEAKAVLKDVSAGVGQQGAPQLAAYVNNMRSNLEGLTTSVRETSKDFVSELANINKNGASLVKEAIRQQQKSIELPSNVPNLAATMDTVSDATKGAVTSLQGLTPILAGVDTAADKAGSSLAGLSTEANKAGTQISEAAGDAVKFEHVANALGGRMSKMFDMSNSTMATQIEAIVQDLREASTSQDVFKAMFSPDVLARVKELTAAFTTLETVAAELNSNASQENISGFIAAQREVLRIRQEIANTFIKTNSETGTVRAAADIEAQEVVLRTTEASKRVVERTLSLLSMKSDVLQNEATLQRTIVDITKAGGNAEEATIAALRDRATTMKQLVQYADRLLVAEQRIANVPQSASMLDTRRALASEAYKAYSRAALADDSTRDSSEVTGNMTKAINARQIVEAIDAQKMFRQTVLATIGDVEMGLAPAYGKVSEAMNRYVAVADNAFARNSGDVHLLMSHLRLLGNEYDRMRAKNTLATNKEASSLLGHTRTALNAAENTGAFSTEQVARARELVNVQQKELDLAIATSSANQKINEDLAKLLLYKEAGVDAVGNMARMQSMYMDALKKGLTIEEALAAATTNKHDALRSVVAEYKRIDALADNAMLTEAQQLEMRRAALELLKMAVPLQKELGAGVNVGGKRVSDKSLGALMESTQKDIAAREKNLALAGRLKSNEVALSEITAARAKAENEIINTLVRANDLTQAGQASRATYVDSVNAYVEAQKRGIDVTSVGLDMDAMRRQALSSLINEENNLAAIMADENSSALIRNSAAVAYLATLKQIKAIVGDTPTQVGSTTIDKAYLAAAENKYNTATGTPVVEQRKPMSIPEVASMAMTDDEKVQKAAAAGLHLADAMRSAKEEILAGNNVLENFTKLQKLAVQATEQGVGVESETLRLLIDKQNVMKAIADTAQKLIATGKSADDPGVKALAYSSGMKHFDALENMASPEQSANLGLDSMKKSLDELRTEAGAALPGSFREARNEADKLEKLLERVNIQVQDISKPTTKSSFETHRNNLERMLPIIEQLLKKEQSIVKLEEFRDTATDDEMNAQYKKIANLERIESLIKQIRQEQNKYAAAAGRLGLDDETAYSPTAHARRGAIAASDTNKDPKAYLAMTESARNQAALNRELAKTVSDSNLAALNTEKFNKAMRDSVDPAKEVADNLALSEKSQAAKASRQAGQDMFDINRMSWFLQLRMFWSGFTSIQQTITESINFAHTLNVVRSVAQTTGKELQVIREEFDKLSQVVPVAYSAMADAVLTVAKAGFSAKESIEIVAHSAKLAQATGDDLKKIADLQTVIIHSWGLGAENSSLIADQLYNAVAKSRADIQGLDSAVGYIAGIAPMANVGIDEALGMISLLSNAGLSMSKTGTYIRQFLNDLLNPTDKFVTILNKLGLSISDVDPRLHKIGDIFKLLASRGMNVADAFEGMSLRAASAFSILLKQPELINAYADEINKAGTVTEAYKHTIHDFSATMGFFNNSLVAFSNTLGEVFGPLATNALRGLGGILNSMTAGTSAAFSYSDAVKKLLASLVGGIVTMYALHKAVTMLSTAFSLLGTNVSLFTKIAAVPLRTLIMYGAAASVAFTAYKLLRENYLTTSAEDAEKAVKRATDALEELRNKAGETVKVRIDFSAAMDATDSIMSTLAMANETKLDSKAGRALRRTYQKSIIGMFRASSDEATKALGDRLTDLVLEVDMDYSLAKEKWSEFESLVKEGSDNMAKSFTDKLAKNMEELNAKVREVMSGARNSMSEIRALTKDIEGEDKHDFRKGKNKRDISPMLLGLESSLTGKFNLGATLQSAFYDNVKSVEDFDKWLQILKQDLADFNVDTKPIVDAVLGEKTFEGKMAAAKKGLADIRSYAENTLLDINKRGEESSFMPAFLTDTKSPAYAQHFDNIAKHAQALTAESLGSDESIAALQDMQKMLVDVGKTLDRLGEKSDLSGNKFVKAWREASAVVEKAIPKHIAARDRATADTARTPGQVKKTEKDKAARTAVEEIENTLQELNTATSAAKSTASLVQAIPTETGVTNLIKSVEVYREKFALVLGQMMEMEKHDPFGTMASKFQQFAVSSSKELYSITKVVHELQGGAKTVAALRDMAGQATNAGTAGIDTAGMMRLLDMGKDAYTWAKAMAEVGISDSLQDIIGNATALWKFVEEATAEKGLQSVHGKLRELAMQSYKALAKYRQELNKSLSKTSRAVSEYAAATEQLAAVQAMLQDGTAASILRGETAEKISESTAKLRKFTDAMEDTKEAAKVAQQFIMQFEGSADIPQAVTDTLINFADQATGRLGDAQKAAEELRKEIARLAAEMVRLTYEQKKSDFEFDKRVKEIQRTRTANVANEFATAQTTINERRSFIGKNARYMDAAALKSALSELQNDLLTHYDKYFNTASGQSAEIEARNIQGDLNSLNEAIKAQLDAEKNMKITYYNEMTSLVSGISSTLNYIQGVLTDIRSSAFKGLGSNQGMFANREGERMGARYTPSSIASGAWGLTSRYESGKDGQFAIGYDKKGDTSYGMYQLASGVGSMASFMRTLETAAPDIAEALKTAVVDASKRLPSGEKQAYSDKMWATGSNNKAGAGPQAWIKASNDYGDRFLQLQRDYIQKANVDPIYATAMQDFGVNLKEASLAVQAAMVSLGVQFGGAGGSRVFKNAFTPGTDVNSQAFLERLYAERGRAFPDGRGRYTNELQDALNLLKEHGAGPASPEVLKNAVTEGVVAAQATTTTQTASVTATVQSTAPGIAETDPMVAALKEKMSAGLAAISSMIPQGVKDLATGFMNALAPAMTTAAAPAVQTIGDNMGKIVGDGLKEQLITASQKVISEAKPEELATRLDVVAESFKAAADGISFANTPLAKFSDTVVEVGTAVGKASDEYSKASDNLQKTIDNVSAARAELAKIQQNKEWLMPKQALESYISTFESPNAATQRTFNSLADNIHTGVSSAIVSALKTVGTGDDWREAAEQALENMTWQMIDTWIQTLMKMASQDAWLAVAGNTGMTDPTTGQPINEGTGSMFGHWWGTDTDMNGTNQYTSEMLAQQQQTGGIDAAATALQANAAADAQNIAQDAVNIAAQQGMQATEQALANTDKVVQATEQTSQQTFLQATTIFMESVPIFQSAATTLQQAASALQQAAAQMASQQASEAGTNAMGAMGSVGGAAVARHFGGSIPGYNSGGLVRHGNRQADSTLVAATKGEYMIQEPVVRSLGTQFFEKLNAGKAQEAFNSLAAQPTPFTDGTAVQGSRNTTTTTASSAAQQSGGTGTLNIMNVTDSRIMEQYLASPRGKKVIMNLAVQGVSRYKG